MAKPGPVRTPTALLAARGSSLAPTRQATEVALPPGCPTCPDYITGEGRRLWDHVCTVLAPTGALSELDWAMLAVLCDTYEQWQEAAAHVKKHGATYTMDQGGQKIRAESPEARRAKQLAGEMRQLSALFGLSPSGRASLSLPAGRPKPSAKKETAPGGDVRRAVFGE